MATLYVCVLNPRHQKVWKDEGSEFITASLPRDTRNIFIDGQILLMQSRVDGGQSWRDFALAVFGQRLARAHGSFDHVVLAFDNYRAIPVFKSIEQAKRVKRAAPFPFNDGDSLGRGPPDPAVWASALQNRTYKTHVICALVGILLDTYSPPRRGTSLTLDFINSVRVQYKTDGTREHAEIAHHAELGESDVKFMRYADACPRLVVDSIDSDVVLIAMLYAAAGEGSDVFVRRRATFAHGEVQVFAASFCVDVLLFLVMFCDTVLIERGQESESTLSG